MKRFLITGLLAISSLSIFAQETMDNDEITKVFAQLNEEQEQDIKMVIVGY